MPEAVEVFVGVGSNVERERNIREGLRHLRHRYGALLVSPVYDSAPVGFPGHNFLNLVVGFTTTASPQALVDEMREIESQCGRTRTIVKKYAPQPLDLDLLLYGEQVSKDVEPRLPREGILHYGFVLKPLADLIPKRRHPVLGEAYEKLWTGFSGEGATLRRVDFDTESG